jgi:BolA family transcriptional regulator, general stress-responsive regulator
MNQPLDPSAGWVSVATLEAELTAALQPVSLAIDDDSHLHAGHAGAREGRHYTVHIVSLRFAGLSRVARHRLVYDALRSSMQRGIHALAIDARAPGEA